MSKKKNKQNIVPVKKTEEPIIIKQEIDDVLLTLRQFFYVNKQYNESLIKTLERTYNEQKKSENDWVDIMIAKKIIFK
jgi:uncharacterized protein YlbG (UPF0298 family)